MKLKIEVNGEDYIKTFFSILNTGVFECIKKNKLSVHQAEEILFFTKVQFMLEGAIPEVGDVIHEGTELGFIERHVPHKLQENIDRLQQKSLDSIGFDENFNKHINYILDKGKLI